MIVYLLAGELNSMKRKNYYLTWRSFDIDTIFLGVAVAFGQDQPSSIQSTMAWATSNDCFMLTLKILCSCDYMERRIKMVMLLCQWINSILLEYHELLIEKYDQRYWILFFPRSRYRLVFSLLSLDFHFYFRLLYMTQTNAKINISSRIEAVHTNLRAFVKWAEIMGARSCSIDKWIKYEPHRNS